MNKKIRKVMLLLVALSCCVCLGIFATACNDDKKQLESSSSETSATSYVVRFDANGGTAVESQTIEAGGYATEPQTSREGYMFVGWFDGKKKFDFTTSINESVTLTAKWAAFDDVTYYVDVYVEEINGDWRALSQKELGNEFSRIRFGSTDSAIDLTTEATSLLGKLEGFCLNTEKSVLTGSVLANGSAQFTIYAARERYTLSFVDETGAPFDGIDAVEVTYGASISPSTLPTIPAKEGTTRAFWKIDDVQLLGEVIWKWSENKAAIARYYVNPKTVTFKNNGTEFYTVIVESGETVAVPSEEPKKTGYSFLAWKLGDAAYNFETVVNEDLTLEASFKANQYTLDIYYEGVDEKQTEITVEYDAEIVFPLVEKEGYDLVWKIDGEIVGEKEIWEWTENKKAVACWEIKTFSVTFEYGSLQIAPQTVNYGTTVTPPQLSIESEVPLGYEIKWFVDGVVYDFKDPVTKDMNLIGKIDVKTVGFANRWTNLAGTRDTSGTEYEGKKTLVMQTVPDGTTSVDIALYNPFDLTAEEIDALIADGYTKIRFELYSPIADTTDYNGWFTSFSQGWNTITVDLENLKTFTKDKPIYYHWTVNKDYSNMVFAITVPTILKTHTVTAELPDGTTDTVRVIDGEKFSYTANAPLGYEYVWTLNGEPYDFDAPVTGDMTLVGTKQVRTVGYANRWTSLAGRLDTSGTVYEGKKTLVMHTVPDDTTNAEFGLYNPFDLTAEEIDALIADGYTKIRFELYSSIADTTDYNGWFTFLTQGWNTITVDLSELTRLTGQSAIYYHWTGNKDYSNMVFAITVPTIIK